MLIEMIKTLTNSELQCIINNYLVSMKILMNNSCGEKENVKYNNDEWNKH